MQILVMLAIAAIAVVIVSSYRKQRDREELSRRVQDQGGQIVRLTRAKKGHPFPSTGRGRWAWRVEWQHGSQQRTSWALTNREGILEWRD